MKITVLAVGRLKERYLEDAVGEYARRLGRYCKLDIIQVPDERTPEGASLVLEEQIRDKEGKKLLARLREDWYVIALAIQGEMLDSVQLAKRISRLGIEGHSHLAFVIGGSLGLSGEVLKRADYALSFSMLTFPHQLMRVILLEQIYRSFRIQAGEPYHK